MTDYFEIAPQDSADPAMIARLISPEGPYVFRRFDDPSPIVNGPALSWSWDAPAPLSDWCPVVARARVFSPRMADVVSANLGPRDVVQWVPATIVTSEGVRHTYQVPHFLHYPDIYDEQATQWGPSGLPVRWVLSRPKLTGLHFFARPGAAGPVVVSDVLLNAMRDAHLTGLDARPVRITG